MVGTRRCKLWQLKADSYFDRSNDSLCDHGQVVQFSCALVNKTIKLLKDKKQKVPWFYWKKTFLWTQWINDKNNKMKHGCNPQPCQIYHKNIERVQGKRRWGKKKSAITLKCLKKHEIILTETASTKESIDTHRVVRRVYSKEKYKSNDLMLFFITSSI